MTVRHIETRTCNRCHNAFEQHNGTGTCLTTQIGWRIYNKGGGSWRTDHDPEIVVEDDNLDKDLCETCTQEFKDFMAGRAVIAHEFPEDERVWPEDLIKQRRFLKAIQEEAQGQRKFGSARSF